MFDRPYSRTLEAEADKIGLQLAAKVKRSIAESTVSLAQLTNVCCLDMWRKHRPNIKSCTVLTLCSTHLCIIITKFYRQLKYNKRFAEPTVKKFQGRVKCPCWLRSLSAEDGVTLWQDHVQKQVGYI